MSAVRKPEVMSPAGYWPQLRAAVEAGADAVYFGLKHFSARAKVGFEVSELAEVMATLHRRGVKGYVTFNTLVFQHELDEAARTLAAIARAGADAIIVQDVGIVKLAKAVAPDLEIHGSTQMSVTSADGVLLAQKFGVSRVTLGRELSLAEVRTIRETTDCELEIFVHGALCVAYSGQCFSSEAWGGRSANRGQCAQACRLPYEMMVDGKHMPLGDARYLLSPGDLYALRQVPEMVDIGIHTLKIEGRYKDADYVALTTSLPAGGGRSLRGNESADRPRGGIASGAGLLAGPRSVLHQRNQPPDGGQRTRAAASRGIDGSCGADLSPWRAGATGRSRRDCSAEARRWRGLRRGGLAQPRRARGGRPHFSRGPSGRQGGVAIRQRRGLSHTNSRGRSGVAHS